MSASNQHSERHMDDPFWVLEESLMSEHGGVTFPEAMTALRSLQEQYEGVCRERDLLRKTIASYDSPGGLGEVFAAIATHFVEPLERERDGLKEQYKGEKARAKWLQCVVDEAEVTERSLKEQYEDLAVRADERLKMIDEADDRTERLRVKYADLKEQLETAQTEIREWRLTAETNGDNWHRLAEQLETLRREHTDGERCEVCSRRYELVWFAPDDLWRRIWDAGGGLLCPDCFVDRCRAIGVTVCFEAKIGSDLTGGRPANDRPEVAADTSNPASQPADSGGNAEGEQSPDRFPSGPEQSPAKEPRDD